jgi:hypothetical protein
MLVEMASAPAPAVHAHDLGDAGTISPQYYRESDGPSGKSPPQGRAGADYSSNVTLTLSVTG